MIGYNSTLAIQFQIRIRILRAHFFYTLIYYNFINVYNKKSTETLCDKPIIVLFKILPSHNIERYLFYSKLYKNNSTPTQDKNYVWNSNLSAWVVLIDYEPIGKTSLICHECDFSGAHFAFNLLSFSGLFLPPRF